MNFVSRPRGVDEGRAPHIAPRDGS
jgi:hypothetical protein